MSEASTIERSKKPLTVHDLTKGFENIGLRKGGTVIVHSSLSSLGYVCGGAIAVVQALMQVITKEGTIVMPTHTSDYSDPSTWGNPPIPEEWWETIRQSLPAFDPTYTPTREMGKVVEVFRTMPDVYRSDHPTYSFAAWGKKAKFIVENQPLDYPMGEGSPLARLYELDGEVLLIGTGYDTNTSFHYAEYSRKDQTVDEEAAPILKNGQRIWVRYKNIEYDTDSFALIGKEFEQDNQRVTRSFIGLADCRLFPQKEAVDFAVQWFEKQKQNDLTVKSSE